MLCLSARGDIAGLGVLCANAYHTHCCGTRNTAVKSNLGHLPMRTGGLLSLLLLAHFPVIHPRKSPDL